MGARQESGNGLIRWMLESPGERLVMGLLVPLGVLAGLVGILLINFNAGSDIVYFNPKTNSVSSGPVYAEDGTPLTQKRVKITYWEKWSGFEGAAIKETVDYFNRKQDRIYVELLVQGDISQKVRIATAGGDPPDLAGLYSFDVPVFAAQNALIPLDEMLRPAGIGAETYVAAYWRLCVYRGKVWTLPTTPSTLALHWNKKLFRKAGLDPDRPPRTIAEFDEYAEKLTVRDKDGKLTQVGFMQTDPGWWKYSWGFWFGGELWNGKDAITANSPENLAAMEWVRSYVTKYGLEPLDRLKTEKFDTADNSFFTGKVAMEIQGVWMANFINKYAPKDFEWGAAAFPSVKPDQNVTIAEADVIGIPRGAKHPNEAFEFMKFMATPEGMEILCRGHAKNSPLRKSSPGWETTHPNKEIKVFTGLAESPNCKRTPPLGIWREYQQAFGRAFDDVWTGKKEPKPALDELQAEMQRRFEHEVSRAKALGIELGEER